MRAHFAINDYAVEQDLLEIPHTTCVAAVVQDDMAYWAHVGDSRLYLFSDGSLLARTEDHTAVAQLVRDGIISEEEAGHSPGAQQGIQLPGRLHDAAGGMQRADPAARRRHHAAVHRRHLGHDQHPGSRPRCCMPTRWKTRSAT